MLARFFHAWEHRLASVTKDRVVRPFEWGDDWLSPNGHSRAVDQRVAEWVDEIMRDTDAFFASPPTSDYAFTAASAAIAAQGEAGTLRFPSALVTPHTENNTVVARWFPAATEPPLGASGTRGRAVVVLPQW